MSASPPKADINERDCHVRFVPIADIGQCRGKERAAARRYPFGRCSRCSFGLVDKLCRDLGEAFSAPSGATGTRDDAPSVT
jgi:hypothetical protein